MAQQENGPDAIYVTLGKSFEFGLTGKFVSIMFESSVDVEVVSTAARTFSMNAKRLGKSWINVKTKQGQSMIYLVVVPKKNR